MKHAPKPIVSRYPTFEKETPHGLLRTFEGKTLSVTEYTLPENCCRKIGEFAFRHFPKLRRLVLSEGITEIFSEAFIHCPDLEEIVLPSTLKSIGREVFLGCKKLRSITYLGSEEEGLLPPALTEIGDDAFRECEALTTLTIPASVSYIGSCILYDSGIKSIKLLGIDHLKKLPSNAFAGAYEIPIDLPKTTAKRTVPYTPDMGEYILDDDYAKAAEGKTPLEQAAALTFSYPSRKKEAPLVTEIAYTPSLFLEDFSMVNAMIVKDGLLVGFMIPTFVEGEKEKQLRPILIGQYAHTDYDADYYHTGDNNGAGYKGDDDDNAVYTPQYVRLQYYKKA